MSYQGEPAGQLLLAPRSPDAPFSVADQRLLNDVARQAGVVAHAVQLQRDLQHLAGDLQQARERLVATREEERRRLRRDLHDGLGPSLASLTFKLDAARSLMTPRPGSGRCAAVHRCRPDAGHRGRDPPAGLQPAAAGAGPTGPWRLRWPRAPASSAASGVVVDAPPDLPPLPAAVEVAAYRIAQEALTNVARHADARHCWLRLWLEE